ncbi:hypothetical protein KC330_g8998 [Hortaea werneckii]|nr:hypothetical protein KC330_g8998 [Hortaea werneckii]
MAPKKRKAEVDHRSRKKKAVEGPPTYRIIRNMTTDAARYAVFETAGLLENIVIQLPPRKIFVIQRVCKHFRDIVATSVKLQQKLFLRSDSTEAQEWRVAAKRKTDESGIDRPVSFRYVKSTDLVRPDEHMGKPFKPIRLGHALERSTSESENKHVLWLAYSSTKQSVSFRQTFDFLAESSLGRTYLASPPLQQCELCFKVTHKSADTISHNCRVEVSNPNGLKFADILLAIRYCKFSNVDLDPTATEYVPLMNIIPNEDFFDETKVRVDHAWLWLRGYIAPSIEEWAAMAG